jgi:putative endonuclease
MRWRLFKRDPTASASNPASKSAGAAAEELALRHLQQNGLTLIARNFRCTRGEIDLVMRDGDAVVFVEVRARRSAVYGAGAETVDQRKQAKLCAAAAVYLQQHPRDAGRPCRFDVVAISTAATPPSIDWIPDAFHAIEH